MPKDHCETGGDPDTTDVFAHVQLQPLDRMSMNFYVLRDGELRIGNGAGVVGTYSIQDGHAVITFDRTIPMTTTIMLSSPDPAFDETTSLLQSSATYTLPDGSDPYYLYGSFVRRIAGLSSTDDVRRRAG